MKITAPGKLVLMGEYAVLRGHPAIVAAVDVRATCRVDHGKAFAVAKDEGGLIDACLAEAGTPARGEFVVDTAAFRSANGKLGLGSSAAACVAFMRALQPHLDVAELHTSAQRAHRAFQKGRGSGIDVCASVYGGVQRFTRHGPDAFSVEPVRRLPESVVLLAVFTGVSADTREFLKKVEGVSTFDLVCARLADASERFQQAVVASDLFAAVDAARVALAALGAAADADIVSEPHKRIAHIAALHGGAAKPSGAGGGDVALVFAPGEVVPTLAAALGRASFRVLPFAIGVSGVEVRADVLAEDA